MGKAIYDFEAGGTDEVDLKVGDIVQIQYEVEGWYHVSLLFFHFALVRSLC